MSYGHCGGACGMLDVMPQKFRAAFVSVIRERPQHAEQLHLRIGLQRFRCPRSPFAAFHQSAFVNAKLRARSRCPAAE